MEQILGLTLRQLNLLIRTIKRRLDENAANSAIVMRMAIAANLTDTGAEVFQEFIEETFHKPKNEIIKPEDFSKFGLEAK